MRYLIVLLALCWTARGANPSFESFNTNQFKTNATKIAFKGDGSGAYTKATNFNVADGTLWVSSPAEFRVSGTGTEGEGRFLISDLNGVMSFRTTWVLSSLTNGILAGDLSLNGRTNRLSIANNTLLLDGVAIGGSTSTNYYNTIITTNLTVVNNATISNITVTNITVQNNLVVSNLYTVNGNHNTLIVTNALTLGTIKTNVLGTTSTGLITNINYGSGLTWTPSTLTLSASVTGAASTWVPNTALTYSGGTNLTIDGSGGTNFFVLLTNTAFFATPSNIPASKSTNTSFTVFFQQDSAGAWAVTWTNASFKWPGGAAGAFQPTTNANAVSWVSFTMSPFTNGIFMGDYGVLDSK